MSELKELCKEYIKIDKEKKICEAKLLELKGQIKKKVAVNEHKYVGNISINRSTYEKKSFDMESFKDIHPEIHKDFEETKEIERFLVREELIK